MFLAWAGAVLKFGKPLACSSKLVAIAGVPNVEENDIFFTGMEQ